MRRPRPEEGLNFVDQTNGKGARATLQDVADATGVTLATASRALSGAYGVHPDTRKRVLETAAQLDYKANRFARGLVTGRSNAIGLIISDIRNSYFAEAARGVEDAAYKAGMDVLLCNSDVDSGKQMHYINSLIEKRVDGIIMNSVATLTIEEQDYIASSGIPVVLLNRAADNTQFSTVCADNERGGRLMAECLLTHGHRNIVHFTGPRNNSNLAIRTKGFLDGLRRAGKLEATVIHGLHTMEGGYQMAKNLLRSPGKVTAISTANDAVAFGVIKAALEMGVRIPGDISLGGFDDVELAALVYPPLTTIRQPKYEMGAAALEMVMKLANNKHRVPEHRVLGVELMERASIAKPRTSR
jgi:DNA-binding LacI/PurR family transcriptional regulator